MTAAFSGTRIERNTSISSTKAPSTTAPITSGRYFSTRWVRSISVAVAPPTWAVQVGAGRRTVQVVPEPLDERGRRRRVRTGRRGHLVDHRCGVLHRVRDRSDRRLDTRARCPQAARRRARRSPASAARAPSRSPPGPCSSSGDGDHQRRVHAGAEALLHQVVRLALRQRRRHRAVVGHAEADAEERHGQHDQHRTAGQQAHPRVTRDPRWRTDPRSCASDRSGPPWRFGRPSASMRAPGEAEQRRQQRGGGQDHDGHTDRCGQPERAHQRDRHDQQAQQRDAHRDAGEDRCATRRSAARSPTASVGSWPSAMNWRYRVTISSE